jgi:hypothetical protein
VSNAMERALLAKMKYVKVKCALESSVLGDGLEILISKGRIVVGVTENSVKTGVFLDRDSAARLHKWLDRALKSKLLS